jgi:hypothetical protein
VQIHRDIKEISLLNYLEGSDEYCVPLSQLVELRKIALPSDCLIGKLLSSK